MRELNLGTLLARAVTDVFAMVDFILAIAKFKIATEHHSFFSNIARRFF